MTFMTMAGWAVVPLALAFAVRFPWLTLVLTCCALVVVLPSFTLAMGAWVLAMTAMIVRLTWVPMRQRRTTALRRVSVQAVPVRSSLIASRSRSW